MNVNRREWQKMKVRSFANELLLHDTTFANHSPDVFKRYLDLRVVNGIQAVYQFNISQKVSAKIVEN